MRLAHCRSRPLCPVFRHRGHIRLPVRRVAQRTVQRVVLKSNKAHSAVTTLRDEDAFQGLTAILDVIKWKRNLVPVIVQHVDTGEVLMQAYADRAAISETLQTKLATFYSRSRERRWCKGETSGNYIRVSNVYLDCDKDSIIYLGDTGERAVIASGAVLCCRTCWFSEFELDTERRKAQLVASQMTLNNSPVTTLYQLERTIDKRKTELSGDSDVGLGVSRVVDSDGAKSWTAKLLNDPELLYKKIVEEANELCDSVRKDEGRERTAEEMADVLYHSMVLLSKQGVEIEEVLRILRKRFGVSGIEEKKSRAQKE